MLACLEFKRALELRAAEGLDTRGERPEKYGEAALGMFERFSRWIDDPTLYGRPAPPPGAQPTSVLGEVMCLAGLAEEFIAKFPERRGEFLPHVDSAMRRVKLHYDAERRVLMEAAHPERGVEHDTMAGRFFNPGHSIEVAWFLLHLCRLRPSDEHRTLALDVLEGSCVFSPPCSRPHPATVTPPAMPAACRLVAGWDSEAHGGGLLYMMDILGKPILDTTVTATNKLYAQPPCAPSPPPAASKRAPGGGPIPRRSTP